MLDDKNTINLVNNDESGFDIEFLILESEPIIAQGKVYASFCGILK
jgi:hypothetical protein